MCPPASLDLVVTPISLMSWTPTSATSPLEPNHGDTETVDPQGPRVFELLQEKSLVHQEQQTWKGQA